MKIPTPKEVAAGEKKAASTRQAAAKKSTEAAEQRSAPTPAGEGSKNWSTGEKTVNTIQAAERSRQEGRSAIQRDTKTAEPRSTPTAGKRKVQRIAARKGKNGEQEIICGEINKKSCTKTYNNGGARIYINTWGEKNSVTKYRTTPTRAKRKTQSIDVAREANKEPVNHTRSGDTQTRRQEIGRGAACLD